MHSFSSELLRLDVPPGRDPPESGPGEGGEGPADRMASAPISVRVGAVICTLLRCHAHVETHMCVHKARVRFTRGWFSQQVFPSLLWRSSAVLSCHRKCIASPLLKCAQLFSVRFQSDCSPNKYLRI